jgi:hypothetical protein
MLRRERQKRAKGRAVWLYAESRQTKEKCGEIVGVVPLGFLPKAAEGFVKREMRSKKIKARKSGLFVLY